MPRSNIQIGDLVRRNYHVIRADWIWSEIGIVVDRDSNGLLDILWGKRLEHMWDDYDLIKIEGDDVG